MLVLAFLGVLALAGHFMFWISVFNRIHATAIPHHTIKLLERIIFLILMAVPAALVWLTARAYNSPEFDLENFALKHFSATIYATLCWGTLAVGVPMWLIQRLSPVTPKLVGLRTTIAPVRNAQGERPTGDAVGRLFARIPFNEIFELTITEKTLAISRLPAKLEGFTIAHLSDLHFTGHLDRDFFEFMVDRANEMDPQITVITGDIVDEMRCLPWIGSVLGRLRAQHGVYCILGNHDRRQADVTPIRKEIERAGMIDLGGKTRQLDIAGEIVVLAGNEAPWFTPTPDMQPIPSRLTGQKQLRILLSHSPDQISFGVEHDFDLVLAGHTHGGQIQIPGIGPVLSPSRFGVKYASGVFSHGDLVMHVSRGVSGVDPIRWNCPPEIAKLMLRTE